MRRIALIEDDKSLRENYTEALLRLNVEAPDDQQVADHVGEILALFR